MNDFTDISPAKPLDNLVTECKFTDKNLELNEVDKLLKEMEETQREIEDKLKMREVYLNCNKTDQTEQSKYLYKVGENINAVPDLGYGVREQFFHKTKAENNSIDNSKTNSGNHPDSIEEPFIQKKITQLGYSADQEKNEVQNLSSPISKLPFKSQTPSTMTKNNPAVTDFTLPKARKKLNYSPLKDEYSYQRSNEKNNSEENYLKAIKERESSSYRLTKGFDNSSGDEETNKQTFTPQRYLKSKFKQSKCMGSDQRNLRNFKPRVNYLSYQPDCLSSNVMSLSNVIYNGNTNSDNDPVKLSRRLEEERCKRQHCEQKIHELQKRLLEEQEKIAVAIQVDKEKDSAIKRLWSGWQQLCSHWSELEEQRHLLTKQLEDQTKAFDDQSEDIRKKVDRWEKELSKALDIASGYKEKCNLITIEREEFKLEMENKMQELIKELSTVKSENTKYVEENKQLVEQLGVFRSETEKDKQLVSQYQIKLAAVENKLNQMEAEICVLREQKENILLKLKDEQSRNKTVTDQKLSLEQLINDYKKQEKTLKAEVKAATERLEISRVELRALYQGQLETVVKEKLNEFQSQLNAAESALRAELSIREKDLAQQAVQRCQSLADSHKLEMTKLEEKHKYQLKAFLKKIEQLESEKTTAESKLKQETIQRTEIARKLHSIMETQWRQALNILSDPTSGDTKGIEWNYRADYNDMNLDLKKMTKAKQYTDSTNLDSAGTAPFNRSDGMNTLRLNLASSPGAIGKKETASNDDSSRQQNHLKKYIEMLLDRTPGNPVPDDVFDQTNSTFAIDETLHLNSSITSDDVSLNETKITDKNVVSRERHNNESIAREHERNRERRQQLHNINKILKSHPWK